uniref:Protein Wnt n=1 Tax=Romanomermis culicivorax TaxID=13658 RepID=A0A915J5V6_ROMCU
AVKVLVTKKCKCHGLSGSCEISTCYKKVAQFRASGDLLLEKFKNAEAVAPHNGGKLFRQQNRQRPAKLRSNKYQRWQQSGRQYRKVRSIDTDRRILMPHIVGDTVPNLKDVGNLVYTEQSPNFCVPNRSLGILSPVGRQCLTTGTAESWGSCQKLCCGKRVVAVETSVVESCNCTFEYCCKVRCERCTWKIFTHHCSNLDA